MIWLWRFFAGYLTITFCGEKAEEILNAAAKNHIELWNLRCRKGEITGNISIKKFRRLRIAKRGIKCRIKIIKKTGFTFYINRYVNRAGFFVGIVLFFLLLELLSNFIWIINVEGNINISNSEILNSCKEIGIKECMPKRKINNKYDAQRLLLCKKELAWASLNVEGCVLTVNLSEAEITDKESRKLPSNLKASFEGEINKIDINSGNAVIKVGDTVSKGDLLVSGIVERLSSTIFVHSDGEIIASTTRVFSAQGDFSQKVKYEKGNIIKRNAIEIFNLKIPLFFGTVKGDHKVEKKVKNLKLFDKNIPLRIATERITQIAEKNVTYDEAALTEILYSDIQKQIQELNPIKFEEYNREVIPTDSGILLKITYKCEENIATQEKILLSTEN